MTELFIAVAGIFGILIGSFLNVVVMRMNTGRTLKGRSGCPHCGHTLTPGELVPIISFVVQKGKCAECRSSISWQYPLVEVLTGGLFALIAWRLINPVSLQEIEFLIVAFVVLAATFSILVVITVYDIQHFIIPDAYVYTFIGIAFVMLFFDQTFSQIALPTLMEMLAGPLAAAPFAFLWLISKGRWMGFGDAKLALGIGWFLRPHETFSALLLAFWIGALYGVVLLVLRWVSGSVYIKSVFARALKQFTHTPFLPMMQSIARSASTKKVWGFTISSEVPFAPFLVLGLSLVFFFHIDVLSYLIF